MNDREPFVRAMWELRIGLEKLGAGIGVGFFFAGLVIALALVLR